MSETISTSIKVQNTKFNTSSHFMFWLYNVYIDGDCFMTKIIHFQFCIILILHKIQIYIKRHIIQKNCYWFSLSSTWYLMNISDLAKIWVVATNVNPIITALLTLLTHCLVFGVSSSSFIGFHLISLQKCAPKIKWFVSLESTTSKSVLFLYKEYLDGFDGFL